MVHVAGTNGKGSLIAFLRAILEAAGYRVQAYTSPHLIKFAERIRLVDGQIGDTKLGKILAECERVNAGEPITYFEITTAAAFLAFSREEADISLIEVGLGGRFDSTNVISTPRLTAITPISLDHQAFLGNTLAKIAREKAGIIKPGVPLVLAKQPRRVRETLLKHSQEIAAPIIAVGIVVNLLLCMLARAVPQMNVFMESFGIRLLIGTMLLGSVFNLAAHEIATHLNQLPSDFINLVRLLAGG